MKTDGMKIVSYKAARGAPFKDEAAPVIGKRLKKLERSGGGLTPEAVVKDARDESSPLHPYFTWDDEQASEAYRIVQARQLINHVVVIVAKDGKDMETKGFHSVRVLSENPISERIYASLETVLDSPLLREQVIQQALKELEGWRQRYGQYEELFPIAKAIDKGKSKLRELQAS